MGLQLGLLVLGNRTSHSQQVTSQGNHEVWRLQVPSVVLQKCSLPISLLTFCASVDVLSGCPVVSLYGTHPQSLSNRILKHVSLPLVPSEEPHCFVPTPGHHVPGSTFAVRCPPAMSAFQNLSQDGFCLLCILQAWGQSSSSECSCGPITWSHFNRVLRLNPYHRKY